MGKNNMLGHVTFKISTKHPAVICIAAFVHMRQREREIRGKVSLRIIFFKYFKNDLSKNKICNSFRINV